MKVLALGGARSGKSAWAESLLSGPVHYIATARTSDPDFDARVREHRERRPRSWVTVDDIDATVALRELGAEAPPVLLDDVGTWLTALFDRESLWDSPRGSAAAHIHEFVGAVRTYAGPLVIVSPEVGMGVIPEHRSGRLFRDEIGALNAALAQECDHVALVVAGLPVPVKGGLPSVP